MYLPKVILLLFVNKIIGLVTTGPQRCSICSKMQGSTVSTVLRLNFIFSCFFFKYFKCSSWLTSFIPLANSSTFFLSQYSQLKVFFCNLSFFLRASELENSWLHCGQLNCSALWILSCSLRLTEFANLLSHCWQLKGLCGMDSFMISQWFWAVEFLITIRTLEWQSRGVYSCKFLQYIWISELFVAMWASECLFLFFFTLWALERTLVHFFCNFSPVHFCQFYEELFWVWPQFSNISANFYLIF